MSIKNKRVATVWFFVATALAIGISAATATNNNPGSRLCTAHPDRKNCLANTTTTSPVTTTPVTTSPVTTSPVQYVFDDEFNGTTLASVWQPNWFGSSNSTITKGPNGSMTMCIDPKDTSVHDGSLDLKLESRSCTTSSGTTYQLAAGDVTTLHSFSFTNGYLEVRAYIPGDSSGLYAWPGIWTDGLGTWPHTGESDIMEGLSGRACWHYHSDAGGPGGCASGDFSGWHTFAENVQNGSVTYYYDGNAVATLAAVKSPHFIILGQQTGEYGGKNVTPTDMLIDYVRVSDTKP